MLIILNAAVHVKSLEFKYQNLDRDKKEVTVQDVFCNKVILLFP
ncbi:hypothetical protein CLOSBL3_11344 [Clostridiaceae bacterium BL-3]|jgi:hypothetical protein|nr:hypothetical protein CLOSBL3_11344 [Clostridiaceae bacterium BL-3]